MPPGAAALGEAGAAVLLRAASGTPAAWAAWAAPGSPSSR
jgi:hypothetical protein